MFISPAKQTLINIYNQEITEQMDLRTALEAAAFGKGSHSRIDQQDLQMKLYRSKSNTQKLDELIQNYDA